MYTTNLYHDTAPICIAILLQKHSGQGSLEHPQLQVRRTPITRLLVGGWVANPCATEVDGLAHQRISACQHHRPVTWRLSRSWMPIRRRSSAKRFSLPSRPKFSTHSKKISYIRYFRKPLRGPPTHRVPKPLQQQKRNFQNPKILENPKTKRYSPKVNVISPKVNVKYF